VLAWQAPSDWNEGQTRVRMISARYVRMCDMTSWHVRSFAS